MPAVRFHPGRLARLAAACAVAVAVAVPVCRALGLGGSFAVPLALLGVRAAQQRGAFGLKGEPAGGEGGGGAGGGSGVARGAGSAGKRSTARKKKR